MHDTCLQFLYIRCQIKYDAWISVTPYAISVISTDIEFGRFKFCEGYLKLLYSNFKSFSLLWYVVINLIIPRCFRFLYDKAIFCYMSTIFSDSAILDVMFLYGWITGGMVWQTCVVVLSQILMYRNKNKRMLHSI